eukprot:6596360-Prymnesium_polylepis.1
MRLRSTGAELRGTFARSRSVSLSLTRARAQMQRNGCGVERIHTLVAESPSFAPAEGCARSESPVLGERGNDLLVHRLFEWVGSSGWSLQRGLWEEVGAASRITT